MNLLNSVLIKILPLFPKFIVYKIAGRYVAGISVKEAVSAVKSLNATGFSATLDILGEHTISKVEARKITQSYADLYQTIKNEKLNCNISVKPTHIGLDISINEFESNLNMLAKAAFKTNNFLRIDMESSHVTTVTIDSILKIQKKYKNVGTVLQAYLYRTLTDINILTQRQSQNIRLCKGIYKESENIAIQNRTKINNNYVRLFKKLIDKNCYVGIATHDQNLIQDIYTIVDELKIDPSQFEFQVLYGVPMGGWLERHLENNYKIRVYVPFGKDWYDYSIRRLRENPGIVGYILKNMFKR